MPSSGGIAVSNAGHRIRSLPRICREWRRQMGTMRERTPGTWELTVAAGVDPGTGKYRRGIRTVRTTSKREARRALASLETEVASGRVSTDDLTLAELLDRWLEHPTRLGRAHTTLYHYGKYIEREIKPVLGTTSCPSSLRSTSTASTQSCATASWLRRQFVRYTLCCAPRSTRPSGGVSCTVKSPSSRRRRPSLSGSSTRRQTS